MTPIQAHVHVPEKPGNEASHLLKIYYPWAGNEASHLLKIYYPWAGNEASHLLKIYYPWAGNEASDAFDPRPPPRPATVQSSKAQRCCG